jgi:FkbM family methyltransferase
MKLRNLLPARFRDHRIVSARKLYKMWEEEHLKRLIAHFDIDCIFDVGAHRGKYAQMLREKVGFTGLIISFEPDPTSAGMLREAAGKDSRWIVEEEALSSFDGEQTFNVMVGSQFSSLSTPRSDAVQSLQQLNTVKQSIQVRTETLVSAYQRLHARHGFRRPYLKLDTQGYDLEIVTHGQPVLGHFVGLQSELAIKRLYENSVDYRDALTAYERLGFVLSAFVPNNRGHFPEMIETDCILVNKNYRKQV